MQANGINQYDVVVHSPTPSGSNSANRTWVEVLVNSGSNVSTLPVGSGGGRIGNAENNAITAGSVFETRFSWGDDPTWNNAQRQADLDIRAGQAVADALIEFQKRMKFFGHEVA
jgi:hypothetical protein